MELSGQERLHIVADVGDTLIHQPVPKCPRCYHSPSNEPKETFTSRDSSASYNNQPLTELAAKKSSIDVDPISFKENKLKQ